MAARTDRHERAVAVVGVGAILPDALNAAAFWKNVSGGRYSIVDVPPERWKVTDYYDPDPAAPDKTYSKIGGWVRGFEFDWKRFHIPPRVAAAMDEGQQWAVTIASEALADYGYPNRPIDTERCGVILGTAMGGERHYLTVMRISFPEFAGALESVEEFEQLPKEIRKSILAKWRSAVGRNLPPVTEDTMPGELANIVSGRVANVLNLRGPNFITDAACASSFAAVEAAVELLAGGDCDAVLTGGVDRNMGASTFVKFCKIGALSATGTRPFGDGADGFVMGEGCAAFLLKRVADAERDGDRIYAVIRGVGASSDGKGKAITAPNPVGQRLATERAWKSAGLDPATATLVEAHGTSTKVGDVVEVESLSSVFSATRRGAIALGSVKSNIGHLKAGAGAAGLLKAVLAVHHKLLPPTLNAKRSNPSIDFSQTPFTLNHEPKKWDRANGTPRRAGVSAYGFGGTNFHLVLEEHVPGALTHGRSSSVSVTTDIPPAVSSSQVLQPASGRKAPLRGALALGAGNVPALREKLAHAVSRVKEGWVPQAAPPEPAELTSAERLVFDFGDREELLGKLAKAEKALAIDAAGAWKALSPKGIFRGSGPKPGKVAFLFPGQGSQYLNMGRELASRDAAVCETFAEADRVLTPILGQPLTSLIFVDAGDAEAMKAAEIGLMQTAVTQPAVLTVDTALARCLGGYDIAPDAVMGHSLGEYGALISADVMPFAHALEAAAARGREMTRVSLDDNGWMAAVMAPLAVVEETLPTIDGYVVAANINSNGQCVIGGSSEAVARAIDAFTSKGYPATRISVSHAFHTKIVAPASGPLRQVLDRLSVSPPRIPLVSNVTGGFYPAGLDEIKDLLQRQIASPVQWVQGLRTLWDAGVRTFLEVGPKRALKGFVDDVFGGKPGLVSLFTNHPKPGELITFNHALCGLWAAGYGLPEEMKSVAHDAIEIAPTPAPLRPEPLAGSASPSPSNPAMEDAVSQIDAFKELLDKTLGAFGPAVPRAYDRNDVPAGSVVISGTGLGLPGAEKPVMDPSNAERILRGEQFVDLIPERFRVQMRDKRVTRVVKGEDGSGRFETIEDTAAVIKLAGRPGPFDLTAEYGVPEKLVEALDLGAQLAIAAGLDALREAGIPLVQAWKKTTTGRHLPDRWMLPEPLRDETGVIFASAFPGLDRFADELKRYYTWEARGTERKSLEDLRANTSDPQTLRGIARRVAELDDLIAREPYTFDRRFLFRVLSMGHSQFAEYIGARGPNTQVNSACASTALAMGLAEDWIRCGRCRRVIVVGADVATSENLLPWIGAGFLASGAAATDDKVDEAALPFDKRRHGTLMGMGACALLVESQDAIEERGMRGLVEVLATETRNSAFHGTRLDVDHISQVMESLVTSAERRFNLNRNAVAPEMVFMSHETFTPARGGSASAEVAALRHTFGPAASEIVVANTKGFTGHPMGVGVEDVIAVKILEHGIVPPVPNFREVDPDLGRLTLSRGGRYPVTFALHLAAGFGSQISLTLTRRIPGGPDRVDQPAVYRRWLSDVSGHDRIETEVAKRTLRIVSNGTPERPPVPSPWRYGLGPVRRAPAPLAGATRQHEIPLTVSEPAPAPPARAFVDGEEAEKVSETPARAATPPAPSQDVVTERVLRIVAEKTGYPPEMLDLDLDLEADLGVDTVKQAETFAAVRAEWNIPREESLKLRDFPTLRHVAKFVLDRRPDLVSTPASAPEREAVRAASSGGASGFATASAPATAVLDVPAPPAPAATPVEDPVIAKVLAIVAEKTGYPSEMLDLDLDLEADLGVDTVKQAETFAAVRTEWDIPRKESLKLRDFPTLRHVVQFVHDHRPAAAASPAPGVSSVSAVLAAPRTPVVAALEDADRVPRRVPVPSLRPPFEFCLPTGVTLAVGKRAVVAFDRGGVGKELAERLQTRGVTVLPLPETLPAPALEAKLKEWRAQGEIHGVFWLPALDVEPSLFELDLARFRELNRQRVKALYTAMRALYESVAAPGTFLVSATRMGGLHGQGEEEATAPLGGAVAGFTKAYKRERPEALVKVVDFAASAPAADVADAILSETLVDPGIVEAGHADGLRWTISLAEQPASDGAPGLTLGKDTVFLVTGAAGGITSAIVADLAAASGGTFWLLDLVPAPRKDDSKIALLRQDREALKKTLIDEAKARGARPTPVAIDKQILGIERDEAALRAVEAVEEAGGTAVYRSVNLLDGLSVSTVVEEIAARHGRIDVLLHAGGVEISRKLSEKEAGEFDLVFDIKSDGFFSLLKASATMPLGATVVFSSIAGRFGNGGQTDYSAANALLCSLSSWLKSARKGTRAVAIDWTAWGGIGMATRGSIPKIMEMAGIEMLAPSVGIPTIRRELVAGGRSGEVVVGGRLGILAAEWHPTGGLDVERINASLAKRPRPLVMVGKVTGALLDGGFTAETTLDPNVQPFLFDHAMDGTPLLPGVMGTEAFAELASVLCPGFRVAAVENVEFSRPFKFHRMQPATLHFGATVSPFQKGELSLRAVLKSVVHPVPGLPPQVREHFRCAVRMSRREAPGPRVAFRPPAREALPIGREPIYRVYFHGPAYQVLEAVGVVGDTAIGLMAHGLPPGTVPADADLLVSPRLLELCFQTAGIHEIALKETLALPAAFKSFRRFRGSDEAGGQRLWALVAARDGGASFDARVVDENGNVYVELLGYRTVALPGRVTLPE